MTLDLGVLAERTVFTAAGRAFDWGDVVEAADLRGELERLERMTREGLACARRAEAEGSAPTAEAVRAAATVFRYERDLLAVEELEVWLGERGLAVSDWHAHL